ncbi:MAG: hypothetical protein MUF34_05460 [Polyangiaceae bacterium]|nr:hypothetical protein [Polyangiaceae bacterium]
MAMPRRARPRCRRASTASSSVGGASGGLTPTPICARGDLKHAPAKRQDEVREVRAALTAWVEARARLERAAQRGDERRRSRAVAAALSDLERLVGTTLLPGVWRLGGGAPAEGAAAARRKLEALAPTGSGGGSAADQGTSSAGAAGGAATTGAAGGAATTGAAGGVAATGAAGGAATTGAAGGVAATGAAGGVAASRGEGADYRSAYEGLKGAQSRLERALAPLAAPEAAAAWHFVDTIEL